LARKKAVRVHGEALIDKEAPLTPAAVEKFHQGNARPGCLSMTFLEKPGSLFRIMR
jgi:hypothetical protein